MWDSQEQHQQLGWEQKWAALDPIGQRELWDRVAVTPFKIVLRPWWVRLSVSPVAWWKHYKLSRKHMGRFHSMRWAFVWTGLLLFPKLFMKWKKAAE